MKRNFVLAILTIAVFLLAGWVGYHFYDGSSSKDTQSNRRDTSSSTGQVNVSRPTDDRDDNNTVRTQTAERGGESSILEYIDWQPDDTASSATACFFFKQPLDPNDSVRLRDYVAISPEVQYSLSIRKQEICLSNLDYAAQYEVTLMRGLPAANGLVLDQDINQSIGFGDKPPYVGFAGEGIILPKIGAQGLAIETVNVDELEVGLYRVNDRMLARRNPDAGEAIMEGRYSWEGENEAKHIRTKVWEGDVGVKSVSNQTVTTVLPLADLIGQLEPGAYIVKAARAHEAEEEEYANAWRWIVVTDMALTSYRSKSGLYVSLRSIDTAKPLANVDVQLVASNNEILAQSKTDNQGHVEFNAALLYGADGYSPKMLMAYAPEGDFAMLDLSRAALDMSSYDVGGRRAVGEVDIYAFTERGVYRPGEDVRMTALLRDNRAHAISDRAVTVKIRRPNGIVISETRYEPNDDAIKNGTLSVTYAIPNNAARGSWSALIFVDGVDKPQTISFAVEDFVPQRLALTIKTDEAPLNPGEIREITVDAQFLYGAPGSALVGEGEARISIDPSPFDGYQDYSFGPADADYNEEIIDMGSGTTDGAGLLVLGLDLKNNTVQSAASLQAQITIGVSEPGGRFVRESKQLPLRTQDRYIGIASDYQGRSVPQGKPAKMRIVALDRNGKPVSTNLTWRLVEEDWDYHWYRESGRWYYRRDVRDRAVSSGAVSIKASAPYEWSHNLDSWKEYRLEIRDEDAVLSSRRFYSGWGRNQARNAPDQIDIKRNVDKVSTGDNVTLSIDVPYSGLGELVIANDKVQMVRPIKLSAGKSDLSFRFDPKWGDSVYALVTLYTPRDADKRPVPRRAAGVSYIALDRSSQTLNVEIQEDGVIRPRQKHEFIVTVDSPKSSDKIWLNFAAVDEGILRLTKYKSPDAADYYFGKKAMMLTIYDDYGRILNPNLGAPYEFKTGGDSLGGEGLTVVPTKTIAIFAGQVPVKNGKAKIELDIPAFNGELRLMATAWSETSIGSDSAPVKVRDAVPSIIAFPRFLAPGDQAEVTVSLDNVEGAAGTYKAAINGTGPVTANSAISLNLPRGERREDRLDILASTTGVEKLSMAISGPGGFAVNDDYDIEVRSPYYPVTNLTLQVLEPGESLKLDPSWAEGFNATGTDVEVSFSRLPGLDPKPVMSKLSRYPYGCTEQTVSRALPLLYVERLGGLKDQSELTTRRNVSEALERIYDRQSSDGAFGLWREGDQNASPWLGIYTTDFLFRAKERGYYVPEDVLNRATRALSELSRMPSYTSLRYRMPDRSRNGMTERAHAAAYALYVLAQNGEGRLGQIRYHFDNTMEYMKSPLAMTYLGGALSIMGDNGRAREAFRQAAKHIKYENEEDYYQSSLRDVAGSISVLGESDNDQFAEALVPALSSGLDDARYLNTQEMGYLILAYNALLKSTNPIRVKADNVKLDTSATIPSAHLYGSDLNDNPTFKNSDKNKIWASVMISGAPMIEPEPASVGFEITKSFHKLDGTPANPLQARQGDRFVIKLSYASDTNQSRSAVIADLLPAGFEIETILRPKDGKHASRDADETDGVYSWVGQISPLQVAEARDDRFIASLEIDDKDLRHSAYIVRAVTPGDFILPGVVINDMYRPEDHALTKAGRLVVAADPKF